MSDDSEGETCIGNQEDTCLKRTQCTKMFSIELSDMFEVYGPFNTPEIIANEYPIDVSSYPLVP